MHISYINWLVLGWAVLAAASTSSPLHLLLLPLPAIVRVDWPRHRYDATAAEAEAAAHPAERVPVRPVLRHPADLRRGQDAAGGGGGRRWLFGGGEFILGPFRNEAI